VNILIDVAVARTGMPRKAIAGVLDAVQTHDMKKFVKYEQHGPGIVENCLEELHYINSILIGIMGRKANKELKREIRKLNKNLTATLDTIS
jgi:isocitrate/isopropylmalate dehydrogenase